MVLNCVPLLYYQEVRICSWKCLKTMVGAHRLELWTLRVKNSGSFYSFYLLLWLSTIWGVCFRSADIS